MCTIFTNIPLFSQHSTTLSNFLLVIKKKRSKRKNSSTFRTAHKLVIKGEKNYRIQIELHALRDLDFCRFFLARARSEERLIASNSRDTMRCWSFARRKKVKKERIAYNRQHRCSRRSTRERTKEALELQRNRKCCFIFSHCLEHESARYLLTVCYGKKKIKLWFFHRRDVKPGGMPWVDFCRKISELVLKVNPEVRLSRVSLLKEVFPVHPCADQHNSS